MRTIIDGELVADTDAWIPAFDWGVIRGFGCFEVLRVYGGVPFRLDQHLDRFWNSASMLGLEPPPRADLAAWVARLAGGDCLIRFYMTGGSRDPDFPTPPRTVVVREAIPALPAHLRVEPRRAPWHPSGATTELAGAKTLSYANNMAASAAAQAAGYDDALLLTTGGTVLEGPTFCIGWFTAGTLYTPSLELGILASITRGAALEGAAKLGLPIAEGEYPFEAVVTADEVFALSTVKEVRGIVAVGDHSFLPGPLTGELGAAFDAIVAAETAV